MKGITLLLLLITISAFGQSEADPNTAIQRYTDLISKTQNRSAIPTFYMQRGFARFQIGDFETAKNDLVKSLDIGLEPQYQMQAQYYVGQCLDKLLRFAEAGTQYTLVLSNMNQDEVISGGITWDQVLMNRIEVRKKQNIFFAALSDLKLYRSFNRQDKKVQVLIDSIYDSNPIYVVLSRNAFRLYKTDNQKADKIYEAFQEGEFNKARMMATAEISRDPIFFALRGFVTMASGGYPQAANDFDKSIQLIPDFNFKGLSNFYLAHCRKQIGDLEGAISSISSAGKVFTSEKSLVPASEVLLSKATWEEEAGRMASAYGSYENYLKIIDDEEVKTKLLTLAKFKDKVDKPLDVTAQNNKVENTPSSTETADAASSTKINESEIINSQKRNEQEKTTTPVIELSDFERAIQRYTQLIQNNGDNANLYMQRAVAYYHSDKFEKAIGDLNTSLKNLLPQYLNQAYCYRALSYRNMNNYNLAIADLSFVLQNTSVDNTPIIANVTTKDLLQIRSELYLKTNKVIPAFFDLQAFRKVESANLKVNSVYDSLLKENPIIQFTAYSVYNYLPGDISKSIVKAKDYFAKGDLSASNNVLKTELTKAANNSPLYLAAAYTSLLMQDFRQAHNYLDTYISGSISFENRALANFYDSFCWKQEGNIDEAINSITNSLKVFSSDRSLIPATDILLLRASLFEKQGFTEMAYNDYVGYLKMKPGDSSVRAKMQSLKPKVAEITQTDPQPTPTQPKEEPKTMVNPLMEIFKNEKRYALVIGNTDYPKEIGILVNPVHDAKDMAEELRKSNFEVTLLLNATYRQIEVASVNFYRTLLTGPKDQTVGLFYYSGHGLQYEGENLIVPIDALAVSPTDIPYVCNKVDKILGKMEAANTRMNIMILDACRSNPFPVADRSFSPGLAQVRPAKGSYVAFATAPGSTASDGVGRNGLYTQELLKSMRLPNLTIEQVFKNVRKNVLDHSQGKQNTWDNSNIVGEFFFKIEN